MIFKTSLKTTAECAGAAAALWVVLIVMHSVSALLNPNSSLHTDILSMQSRIFIHSGEVLLLGAAAAVTAVYFTVLSVISRQMTGWRTALMSVGWILPAGLVLMVFIGEWYDLLAMGQYAGLDGLDLWIGNPRQVLQHLAHMEPVLVLAAPVSAFFSAWIVMLVLLRVSGAGTTAHMALAVPALAVFIGITGARAVMGSDWSLRNDVLLKRQGGIIATSRDLFMSLRDTRTGVLTRISSDLRRSRQDRDPDPGRPEGLNAHWEEQIPMRGYAEKAARSFRPFNVILILVESLRPDQLAAYGGVRPVMPAVDALAERGRVFLDAYTQASHSNYADMCPLSSHYPLRSLRYHLYPENPSYPRVLLYDVLKSLGYRTAVISSQNEHWGQMSNYLRTPSLDYFLHAETFSGPTYVPRADTGFAGFIKGSKRSGKIDDRLTVNEAIKWIGGAPSSPFFIYMNLQNSHVPYEIPADFPRRYSPEKLDFPIRFGQFPKEKVSVVKDVYADSLSYVDAQIAKLIAFLQMQGIFENTLIVITGDTGQAFFEHRFAGHANQVYEELMRVPLIVHGPGINPGRDGRPAQHIDIPPAVLSALGLPPHPSFQGEDLLSPTYDPARPRFLLVQTPLAHQYAVVESGWKLMYNYRSGNVRLFNLQEDPGERTDLSGKDEKLEKRLLSRLLFWKREQLIYYSDLLKQKKMYPPRYAPSD